MNRWSAWPAKWRFGVPRSRGDEPPSRWRTSHKCLCSPLARGETGGEVGVSGIRGQIGKGYTLIDGVL